MRRTTQLRVLAPLAVGVVLLSGAFFGTLRPVAPSALRSALPPFRPFLAPRSRHAAPEGRSVAALPPYRPTALPPLTLTRLADKDPFRLSRQPAPVAYDPQTRATGETPAPPPPRPQFLVSGILWSEAPSALVEGFPGFEGARLVRQGDRVGEFRVLRIRQTAVEIRGPDTTWTLLIREPWR